MPRPPHALPASAAALLATALLAGAAGAPPADSTVPSDPLFTALLIDGSTAAGRIDGLGPDGELTLVGDEGRRSLALRDLVKLTREGPPPTIPPDGPLVLFPEGDRLRAVIGKSGETELETRSFLLGELPVPIDSILGLVLAPPSDLAALEALVDRVRTEERTSEVLWLANGDRLAGGFLGLGPRTVSFEGPTGAVEIDRAQALALGFDPRLAEYPRPEGDILELTLADGSRLGVGHAQVAKGQLVATTRFGAPIRLALGDLARVHRRGEAIVYLSEREPEAKYVGYVGPPRPYRRDRAVTGGVLRLAGQPYDRGLGTQSRTLLAYRLAPGDRRFQALVGLDDRAGPLGSVIFRVLVDGQERYASPPMSSLDPPRPVDVDVSGGKLLILDTAYGERGDVRDHADWAEARLIR